MNQQHMILYSGMMTSQPRNQQIHEAQQMQDIQLPGINDVMCGRGGGTNNHIGNIRFRQLVNGHKLRYLAATKSEKPMVSKEVVTIWRGLQPPGRFLMQEKTKGGNGTSAITGEWYDIGDKKAREKASQCLRERTPEVIPFVRKLDLQLQYQQEAESGDARDGGNRKNAEDLSHELLQEQQQAAITAHQSLNAFLPMSIMTMGQKYNVNGIRPPPAVRSSPYGTEMTMQHSLQPTRAAVSPALMPPMSSMPLQVPTSRPLPSSSSRQLQRKISSKQLKDQIEREIEELQHAQAKLEAEAKAAEKEVAKATGTSNYPTEDIFNERALESFPASFNPFVSTDELPTQLTKEEYRKSVREFLGHKTSSGLSSGESNIRHGDEKVAKRGRPSGSFDHFEHVEALSRESWGRSFNTFGDDTSMNSTGSSMNKMLSGDLEPLDIQDLREGILSENIKTSDKSLGKASLSTYESQILENLISPANIDTYEQRRHGLPNIKEDLTRMPSPRMGMAPPKAVNHTDMYTHSILPHNNHTRNSSRMPTSRMDMAPPPTVSHAAMYSHPSLSHNNHSSNATSSANYYNNQGIHNHYSATGTTRPHPHAAPKGISASMLSNLSDFSNKIIGMTPRQRFERFESISKMKADPSIFADNMSDLSNAMDSLDVSTNKSYKE